MGQFHIPSSLTGCGQTLHRCHPERSEASRPVHLLENDQGQLLGLAQKDSFETFFQSLLKELI